MFIFYVLIIISRNELFCPVELVLLELFLSSFFVESPPGMAGCCTANGYDKCCHEKYRLLTTVLTTVPTLTSIIRHMMPSHNGHRLWLVSSGIKDQRSKFKGQRSKTSLSSLSHTRCLHTLAIGSGYSVQRSKTRGQRSSTNLLPLVLDALDAVVVLLDFVEEKVSFFFASSLAFFCLPAHTTSRPTIPSRCTTAICRGVR